MPKLAELINKKKKNNELKTQLCMGVNFMHTTDRDKNRTFHVKSNNEEIRSADNTNDAINKLIESFLSNYQKEEQILRNGSNYTFESVDILGVHFHDIKLKRGKSYIKSPEWISKKAKINPQNTKDNKCFQYAISFALNHREIGKEPQRISKISPHINKYNWKDIDFPAGTDEYKKFERNNNDIALNILSAPSNEKKLNIICKSKYNRKCKNQVVLLIITDNEQQDTEEKWHDIALKSEITDDGYKKPTHSLSALFRGITSNHNEDFPCLGCLHSYRTDNAVKKHERLCNKHDYCDIRMPSEEKNILKYNSGEKSLKVAHAFYIDLESLLIKHQSSQNNPEESYTERKAVHEPCGYSLKLLRSYDKDTHSFYRGKDCIEKLCKDLKEQAMEIVNYEKKEMIPLTYDENKYYEKKKYCHICKRKFCFNKENKSEYNLYHKVRDHCHYTGKYRDAAHSICNLRYKVQIEIPVVRHNGYAYDYHLIIKGLAEEFKGNIDCLGENTENI